ncbi:MAG: hypothetical protein HS116_02630 [Planctomycetes bacterium]|nr:hypothetical protein [Planctomycetota bacterium]
MPYEIVLNARAKLVHSRAWGNLSDAELLEHRDRIQAHFEAGTLDAAWSHFVDFSAVSHVDVSTATVGLLAANNPWPTAVRRALVAPQDIVFGLSRMYEMFSGAKGQNIRVFRTLDEARTWLQGEPRQSKAP